MWSWATAIKNEVDRALERIIYDAQGTCGVLAEPLAYAVLSGGKRLRALMAYAAGQLVQADVHNVILVGATVELIHAYSLVHDDMPCMDDDAVRRQMPSVHKKFGEGIALLVGDGLQALAYDVLLYRLQCISYAQQVALMRSLIDAIGFRGMVQGQALDMLVIQQRDGDLDKMHILKTGCLFQACAQMGIQCASPWCEDERSGVMAALRTFSQLFGLCYQIFDDLVDDRLSHKQLGKTPGKDRDQKKTTFVTRFGHQCARDQALEKASQARLVLQTLSAYATHSLHDMLSWLETQIHTVNITEA